jgi:hypothetical protein
LEKPPHAIRIQRFGEPGIGCRKKLKLTDSQFENAKIKVKNAKLWNPDVVGTTILIMVLCFMTVLSHNGICLFLAMNRAV